MQTLLSTKKLRSEEVPVHMGRKTQPRPSKNPAHSGVEPADSVNSEELEVGGQTPLHSAVKHSHTEQDWCVRAQNPVSCPRLFRQFFPRLRQTVVRQAAGHDQKAAEAAHNKCPRTGCQRRYRAARRPLSLHGRRRSGRCLDRGGRRRERRKLERPAAAARPPLPCEHAALSGGLALRQVAPQERGRSECGGRGQPHPAGDGAGDSCADGFSLPPSCLLPHNHTGL